MKNALEHSTKEKYRPHTLSLSLSLTHTQTLYLFLSHTDPISLSQSCLVNPSLAQTHFYIMSDKPGA